MRMEYSGLKKMFTETEYIDKVYNSRLHRTLRPAWLMVSWHTKVQGSLKPDMKTLSKLSAWQVANNTTRGSTPGLTNPNMPEGPNNRRVPVPPVRGVTGRPVRSRRTRDGQVNQELPAASTSNPISYPTSGSVGLARWPASPIAARSGISKRGIPRHASDLSRQASAAQALMSQPSAPRAYPSSQHAQGLPLSDDMNTSLTGRPAYTVPQNPFSSTEMDAAQDTDPTTLPPNTGYRTRRNQAADPSSFAEAEMYIPTSLGQPQSGFSRSQEGHYGQNPTQIRPLSPIICSDCGRHDPEALHILFGCSHPTYATPGREGFQDPEGYTMPGQSNTLEESTADTLVSVPMPCVLSNPLTDVWQENFATAPDYDTTLYTPHEPTNPYTPVHDLPPWHPDWQARGWR